MGFLPESREADPHALLARPGRRQVALVEVEAAVVCESQQVVVEGVDVQAADGELVRQEELRCGEPNA